VWYKEKIENILKLAKIVKPDVMCLQEMTLKNTLNDNKNTPKWLAKKLDFNYYFAPAHIYPELGNQESGNAILSRYPIIKKESHFVRSPTAKMVDYSDEGRVYIEVDLKIKKRKITVGTTHLSYSPRFIVTNKRKVELNRLINLIKNNKKGFIFSGDLNARPHSYCINELKRKFRYCGPSIKQPTWTTKPFSYNGFEETRLRWRIDHVFASYDMKVLSSKILQTKYSDHLPICVDFDLNLL
jgi:endonuclease/exonuclease/phosphatase family metal-dependent hydrolase